MAKYKIFIGLGSIVIGLFILTSCQSVQEEHSRASSTTSPNILLIMVDDLGFGDLQSQGARDLLTPNIDALALEGMTFKNFYANCTVCSPTRAALFTGCYPDKVGVPGVIRQNQENSWGYLDPNSKLIPKFLNEQGYHTSLIGKWHLGYESPNLPNDRGFQLFHGFLGDMMDDYWTHQRGGVNWMRKNKKEIHPEGHATDLFTKWAIDYLKDRAKQTKPFALFLTYNAPHFPIQPPQLWLDKVLAREQDIDSARARNVAFIEHLDDAIGQVIQTLKSNEQYDNTLVIFTSDNGGALRFAQRNLPLNGGKQDHYEGGIKVPTFMVWKDRIATNSTNENVALTMDLFPTICDVSGADAPQRTDGTSLFPVLMDTAKVMEDRFLFWMRREGWHYGGRPYYGARIGRYKALQNGPFEPMQYFDLFNDPYEQTTLPADSLPIFADLRRQLEMHIQSAGAVPWQKID